MDAILSFVSHPFWELHLYSLSLYFINKSGTILWHLICIYKELARHNYTWFCESIILVNRNNLRVCLTGCMIEHRNIKIRQELLLRKCQESKGNMLLVLISTNHSKLNCLFSEILKYPLGSNWHNTSHHYTDNHFQNWQLSLQLISLGSIFVSAQSYCSSGSSSNSNQKGDTFQVCLPSY